MIEIENISKSFGSVNILDGVSFKINSKERIGLVGRNGHGKTTLLRMIVGQESFDSGNIIVPKNYRIGYVRQNICFSKETVLGEGMDGLPEVEKEHHWKVAKILSGLGFSQDDMGRNPNEFSGGFQVRLNLAKELVSMPDLLLLDEPTNYLDIVSIRWIKKFLFVWPNELIVVTHDRDFMDKIVTHTVGIHRKKTKKVKGDTNQFYEYIAREEELYEKTRLNQEKKEKEVFLFIERFRAKASLAGMVQSRIKSIGKSQKSRKLKKLKRLKFSFNNKPYDSKNVLNAENLSFVCAGQRPLFSELCFSVKAKERICIIGKNGKGKTSLLKIIAGLIQPTTGRITYNTKITKGVFEQTNVDSLLKYRTVEEEILYSHPGVTRHQARTVCGAMMFTGDSALKKIGVLSGGEKSRVMLGKLLVTPLNLLLLDEPTNHLDMDSSNALLSAIDSFDGTVIIVTHDEMFLHSLAEKLIIFDENRVKVFEGSYKKFLMEVGWRGDIEFDEHQSLKKQGFSKKEIRRIRSDIIKNRSKVIGPIKNSIHSIEKIIQEYEIRINQLNLELISASQISDGSSIQKLSRQLYKCEKEVENQFDKLEEMDQKRREVEIKFNRKLLILNQNAQSNNFHMY